MLFTKSSTMPHSIVKSDLTFAEIVKNLDGLIDYNELLEACRENVTVMFNTFAMTKLHFSASFYSSAIYL